MRLSYERLTQRHPEHCADYWEQCDALYRGGKKLLGDKDLMKVLFPKHLYEVEEIYKERKKRAHYVSHPGSIINWVLAGLTQDPLVVEGHDDKDAYYTRLLDDMTPTRGERCSVHQFGVESAKSAYLYGIAWALIELPMAAPAETLAEQIRSGGLDAYVVPLKPRTVTDWEEDDNGFLWVMTSDRQLLRPTPEAPRELIRETFQLYTREGWERWVVEYKLGEPPKESAEFDSTSGFHTFGVVPLVRLDVKDDGLWAMDLLHSLAKDSFNKRNALGWAEYRSLFAELTEYISSDTAVDLHDIVKQIAGSKHGVGYTQIRDAKDRREYVGPPTDAFDYAQASLETNKLEQHRVVHAMRLAVDPTSSNAKASGESKSYEKSDKDVVLAATGKKIRDFVRDVLEILVRGRQEQIEWVVSGMKTFDSKSTDDKIEQAMTIDAVRIPSATFQIEHLMELVASVLGDKLTDEMKDTIRKELEDGITQDQLTAPPAPPLALPAEEADAPEDAA